MSDDSTPIRELAGTEIRHCTKPFFEAGSSAFTEIETLPYHDLAGPGLERLCYELLLSKGYEPRFFGRTGQAQHGIDLVAEKAGRTEVYQCKNLGARPTANDLLGYLDLFEKEWINQAGLPRPSRFVICCPALLRDSEVDAKWILAKQSFERRTNVDVGLWHLDLLNAWLKKLPDVVADLFSDRHAEAFCGVDDWKPDLFTPLRQGASGDRRLRRYFQSRRKGRLYLDEGRQQKILEALEVSPVILVRGLPGTGKTFGSLAVAEGLRESSQRTYFLDVGDDEFTKGHLKDGIRSRLSRPSVFVLENCHEKVDHVSQALEDLAPLLTSGRASVICLVRRVPGPVESRSDESEFFGELESSGAAVDLENDDELLKSVVEFWRPEFTGLSAKRLSKLAALCGSNLYLLDDVLTLIDSPAEIDELSPSAMYDMVRRTYLGHKTADDFPVTRRLAALSQFEIHPRTDVMRPSDAELSLLENLCVRAGQPPRWHFLHSSAAELVLHSLWSGSGVLDPNEVARQAGRDVIDYFRDVQDVNLRPPADALTLETDLLRFLENRLQLLDEHGEGLLKAAVLESVPVRQMISGLDTQATYPRIVTLCALVTHLIGADTADEYARKLCDVLIDLLTRDDAGRLATSFHLASAMLRALKWTAPALHEELNEELDARRILNLIEANGTVFDLFNFLLHSSSALARGLVDNLHEALLEQLIGKTLAADCVIPATFHIALRELHRHTETRELGEELDRKIGPARFLRILEAKGTVFDLFRIVECTSPILARGLVDALDELRLERLTETTIAAGRRIGNLRRFPLELHHAEETLAIRHALEMRIGPARLLRMIEVNGTIFELFRILEYASPAFAGELVEALDEARVESIVTKTIDSRRSIGNLSWALRELRRRPETLAISHSLERRVGPERFMRLIEANGTIFELFRVLNYASPPFAVAIVEALDERRVDRLVDKTIASGRSIGALSLTLRELRRHDEMVEIGKALEERIGPLRFLRLIEANGTIFELFKIIQHASVALATGLVDALDGTLIDRLIAKTIAARRSIGTLNLTLRELRGGDETLEIGRSLESKIGPERFLQLIEANGTIFELFRILQHASPALARRLVDTLSQERLDLLIEKTIVASRSIGTLNFTLRELRLSKETVSIGKDLEHKIGPDRFLRLIEANGTVFELFMIVSSVSLGLARNMVEALDQPQMDRLIDKTIVAGRSLGTLNFALRALNRNQLGSAIAQALESRLGVAGFWKLMLGTGSPGPLLSFLREVSHGFCQLALAAAHDLSQDQWQRMLGQCDFYQLCELASDGQAVLEESAGGSRLLAAVENQAPQLAVTASWYQRNGASRRLDACPESPCRTAACRALDAFLAQVEVTTLSFPSANEAVNCVDLLYRARADVRTWLGARIRELVPSPEHWQRQPKEDMPFLRILPLLLANPEFAHADAWHFVSGVTNCLTRKFVAKCRTVDLLWTLWALFAFARGRSEASGASAVGQSLWPDLMQVLHDSLVVRVGQKTTDLEELRARFALFGLLALLGLKAAPSVVSALRVGLLPHGDAGAWWLCLDQNFVTAWLILHAVEICRPLPSKQRAYFRERLLSDAQPHAEMDAGYEYLYQEVLLGAEGRKPAGKIPDPESKCGDLAAVDLQTLSFATLKEAITGIEQLYQSRPEARLSIAERFSTLLPPRHDWMLDPRQDMHLPPVLLKLASNPEFSNENAHYVVEGLASCLTRERIGLCRTVDILWTVWAMFACARTRAERVEPPMLVQSLSSDFWQLLNGSAVARVTHIGPPRIPVRERVSARETLNELRAQFALVGLLALLGFRANPSVVTALREELMPHGDAGVWWLCADQTFITAWLILRAVEISKPLAGKQRADFTRRLLSAAEEYSEMDAAAEYLRQDVLRRNGRPDGTQGVSRQRSLSTTAR